MVAAHMDEVVRVLNEVDDNQIVDFIKAVSWARDINHRGVIYTAGNGGSAANDQVVVFTTSGKSLNLLKLLSHPKVKAHAFVGNHKQVLAGLNIHAPSADSGVVEDVHSAMIHAVKNVLVTVPQDELTTP